jgi:tetratricopeptide (TPR) repeat protein/predicted Ser/Thr protein kinase
LISQQISHYRIISRLGAGGMGEVFLAEDTKLERKVAVKLLTAKTQGDENARKRLLREAKAAAHLDHPNICAIYEVNDEGPDVFIVMQYIEGDTLSSRIKNTPLDLKEAINITLGIADALSEAHSRGIIHRDIKPHNVIVTTRGQIKVLDFGLAKFIEQEEQADSSVHTLTRLTESGCIVGTAGYMSPEQVRGQRLDARSDIFSLGVLLYECATGSPPFSGASAIDTCVKVVKDDPVLPSKLNVRVPPDMDRVILKAMAKSVSDRYQSADQMRADLASLLETVQGSYEARTRALGPASGTSSMEALTGRVRRLSKPAIAALLAAAALLVMLGAWAAWRLWPARSHQPSPEATRWYETGASALRDGAYYQASKALERAVEIDNKFALAHARLAEAYAEIDYTDKAKDELLVATSLVPDRSALAQPDALYFDAIAATVRRDFPVALALYRKIADQAAGSEKSRALLDLGRAYEKNENIAEAIKSYAEAATGDPHSATAHLRLGVLYGRRQDLKSATDQFNEAENNYRAMSNQEGLAEVLYERGTLLNNMDRLAEARPHLEGALKVAETTGNKYQQARALLQLSSIAWTEGNTERARRHAAEAIEMAEANGIQDLAINGRIDLGSAYFFRGEYSEAEKYYRQALESAQRHRLRRSQARAQLAFGSLNTQRDNPDEAISYLEQALAFYESAGYRKEISKVLILLSRSNRRKGDYATAFQLSERQLELARDLGDNSEVAASHESLGTLVGFEQEQYAEGLAHFDESTKVFDAIGAKINLGYSQMNRGGLLWRMGRYDEARKALDQASAIASNSESNARQLLAWVHLTKGQIELSRQRLVEAASECSRALALADKQYKEIAIQARYTLGLARALAGAEQTALQLCEEAIAMARDKTDPRLLSMALMAKAEVLLKAKDAGRADQVALEAQVRFNRAGQQSSEWQAWLVAARARQLAGDQAAAYDSASRAASVLSGLQQKWGAEVYNSYTSRPDIQARRKQIDQILAVKK